MIGGVPRPKRIRRKRSRPRKRTMQLKRITRDMIRAGEREILAMDEENDPGDLEDRPKTRGDCYDGVRPCPWVTCKHNLYLDINPETGSITLNFPDLEPWEMASDRSCSLDVAERGGITLDEVGIAINLTRERIRQVEIKSYMKLIDPVTAAGVDCAVAEGGASLEPSCDGSRIWEGFGYSGEV